MSVTVLLESGTEGGGKIEAAANVNKVDGGRIMLASAVLEQTHADIERDYGRSNFSNVEAAE